MARIRQTVSFWCFNRPDLPFLTLCREMKRIGYEGFDLLPEDHWSVATLNGLSVIAIGGHESIAAGLNRVEHHARIEAELRANIDKAAANRIPCLVCFAGNRAGLDDASGLANTVSGLKRVAAYAEQRGVTLTLETLNSKVDHADYMGDRTAWCAEAVRRVGSLRVRMLYDIYHMQVMEGDVIRTMLQNIELIGHVHTAGNPGRHELHGPQELNYPGIMAALARTTYFGCVGQEFVPTGDPIDALERAFHVCSAG